MTGHREKLLRGLAFPWHHARLSLWDAAQNRRYARAPRRFLVVHHPRVAPFFYDILLHWLAIYHPDLRALFELRPLPTWVRDWSPYALHLPWLQDPVQAWSPDAYRRANRLAAQCDTRGIPIVNRVDRLVNATKAEAAIRIATAGLRTPRMARIEDPDAFRRTRLGLSLPLFVREDWGHGGLMLRADTDAELRSIRVETMKRPIAVEIIDVQSRQDGLFRKYRYVVSGNTGVRQTLHVQDKWAVRGTGTVYSKALLDEEIAYTSVPEPEHARFVLAREALGLDFVAFDHSIDSEGRVVVWEANPFLSLHFLRGRYRHRVAPTTRVLAAMTRLFLERAGMEVPADLMETVRP